MSFNFFSSQAFLPSVSQQSSFTKKSYVAATDKTFVPSAQTQERRDDRRDVKKSTREENHSTARNNVARQKEAHHTRRADAPRDEKNTDEKFADLIRNAVAENAVNTQDQATLQKAGFIAEDMRGEDVQDAAITITDTPLTDDLSAEAILSAITARTPEDATTLQEGGDVSAVTQTILSDDILRDLQNSIQDILNAADNDDLSDAETLTLITTEISDTLVTAATEASDDGVNTLLAFVSSFLAQDDREEQHDADSASLSLLQTEILPELARDITRNVTLEDQTRLQELVQNALRALENTAQDEAGVSATLVVSDEDLEVLEAIAVQLAVIIQGKDTTPKPALAQAEIPTVTAPRPQLSATLPEGHFAEARYDARYSIDARTAPQADAAQQAVDGDAGKTFDAILKAVKGDAPAPTTNSAGQAFLQTTTLGATGLAAGAPLDSITAGLQAHAQLAPVQNTATGIMTQSQSATHAHPATQMVSATIQRAVKGGDTTDIKLNLNPPELGRVEVKMSIDKDNATKVVLTVEKPETFLMLQRDVDALQRALEQSGLSAESGIEFELASDSHSFNSPHRDQGGNGKTAHTANGQDDTLIETTLDWQVNPQTGHMHYSILA